MSQNDPNVMQRGAPAAQRDRSTDRVHQGMYTVRVVLPPHLRNLAGATSEVSLEVSGPVTQCSILDALEARYPVLRGTIRGHASKKRRAFVRFFACSEDLSHEDPDAPVPREVASGSEPYLVVGALAGG